MTLVLEMGMVFGTSLAELFGSSGSIQSLKIEPFVVRFFSMGGYMGRNGIQYRMVRPGCKMMFQKKNIDLVTCFTMDSSRYHFSWKIPYLLLQI